MIFFLSALTASSFDAEDFESGFQELESGMSAMPSKPILVCFILYYEILTPLLSCSLLHFLPSSHTHCLSLSILASFLTLSSSPSSFSSSSPLPTPPLPPSSSPPLLPHPLLFLLPLPPSSSYPPSPPLLLLPFSSLAQLMVKKRQVLPEVRLKCSPPSKR